MTRRMLCIVTTCWCLTAHLGAETSDDQRLPGEWVLASSERQGEPLIVAEKGDRFTLSDGKITIATKAATTRDWEYRLDDTKAPKQFDLVPVRRNRSKERFTLRGIYKLDGGRLTICIADPGGLLAKGKESDRPADFAPGATQTLLTFERAQR